MASQVEISPGVTVDIPIPVDENTTPQEAQDINDFFLASLGSDTTPSAGAGGSQVYTTKDGTTLTVFGEGSTPPAKIKGDVVLGVASPDPVKLAGKANKVLLANDGDNTVKAGKGSDEITIAGSGDNTVKGGTGADTITGGSGNDVIKGGTGDDILEGRGGNDTLSGGEGSDTFVFRAEKTDTDTITDFQKKDVIQIQDRNNDGELKQGEDYSISQTGKDVTITLLDNGVDNGNKIIVEGAKLAKVDDAIVQI